MDVKSPTIDLQKLLNLLTFNSLLHNLKVGWPTLSRLDKGKNCLKALFFNANSDIGNS